MRELDVAEGISGRNHKMGFAPGCGGENSRYNVRWISGEIQAHGEQLEKMSICAV